LQQNNKIRQCGIGSALTKLWPVSRGIQSPLKVVRGIN